MLLKDIIIRPYQTEKSLELTEKFNQYTFIVNRNANKIQVRKAIEEAFKVKVVRVNTILVKENRVVSEAGLAKLRITRKRL